MSAVVTFAQAQDRAERWINDGVPADRQRVVEVREFELGFVAWAPDGDGDGGDIRECGRQRLVVARDSGEATLWPDLPVDEVIRRFEETYGGEAPAAEPEPQSRRVDLEATSFLLSPPAWLQEAADRQGIPGGPARATEPEGDSGRQSADDRQAGSASDASGAGSSAAGSEAGETAGRDVTPWAGTDTTGSGLEADRSVPPPLTVFDAPPVEESGGPTASPDAPTRLLAAGGAAPTPVPSPDEAAAVPPVPPMPPRPPSADAADVSDAVTSRAARGEPGVPPPPGPPGVPGERTPAGGQGGYVPTQLVAQVGSEGPPGEGVHQARTMTAGPAVGAGGPAVAPPGPPGPVGKPQGSAPAGGDGPAGTGPSGTGGGGVHQAATVLATGPSAFPGGRSDQGGPPPGVPAAPGPGPAMAPPAVPEQPVQASAAAQPTGGQPMVGPGYMAVLRYRAPDGSEQQLIRRSAPGVPHPEWQILYELRAMNVPPQQVLELHTELESCELPGGYCTRMIRESWPQVRISHTAAYGREHAARRQGIRHLVEHQDELHQVADAPARPAPNRVPLPQPGQVQPAPQLPVEGIAHELLHAFGPQAVFRFDQRAVSRQGVPDVVARTLMQAGLPVEIAPFFWAQAQPGRPVPTLAELAAENGVQPAPDAGSYLVVGSDFGRRLCVQYGTAHIVAVPMEGPAPGQPPVEPQFVNTGLPEFVRCLALLGRMWRLRYGLNAEQAGRWTVDFQAQLVALDPAAVASPENWWSVLLEQMWDGML